MKSIGFLNLPSWHDKMRTSLHNWQLDPLLLAPVLGGEDIEPPWISLEKEEFFSVVDTGLHFPGGPSIDAWPSCVITSDPVIALQRLLHKEFQPTGIRGAIGGTYPALDVFRRDSYLPEPTRLLTIPDGLAGFILTEMEQEAKTMDEALQEAQWQGVAPGNPAQHLHGFVARDRLALLGSALFGARIAPDDVYLEGFGQLELTDVRIADRMDFRIRLLGVIETTKEGLSAWVRPSLIPSRYVIARTRGGMEAAYLRCCDGSSYVYAGPGTSVDVCLRGMIRDYQEISSVQGIPLNPLSNIAMVSPGQERDCYYLRLSLMNFAATLAQITAVFADLGIEIQTLFQPDKTLVSRESKTTTELVMLTDEVSRATLDSALEKIRRNVSLATIKACLRYED